MYDLSHDLYLVALEDHIGAGLLPLEDRSGGREDLVVPLSGPGGSPPSVFSTFCLVFPSSV